MYKFTGGFLNTLQPYNNNIYNGKLIMTANFLQNINDLIEKLGNVNRNITDKDKKRKEEIKRKITEFLEKEKDITNEDISQYLEYCNSNGYVSHTLNEEQLSQSGSNIEKFTLINNNEYFIKFYNIQQQLSTISNTDFDINIKPLDFSKIKNYHTLTTRKPIKGKIDELKTIKTKIENLLNINSFYEKTKTSIYKTIIYWRIYIYYIFWKSNIIIFF
jgi:hypothetical protein